MRDQFRIQLMKLPLSIRKMDVAEFCDKFGADVNAVVSAQEITAKNQAMTPAPKTTSPRKSRKSVKEILPFNVNLNAMQGMGVDEQLKALQAMQSQIDALTSQLKVAKAK